MANSKEIADCHIKIEMMGNTMCFLGLIMFEYMNHPTELREKTFRRSQKASRNFCRKLNLLFRFKLEKYLCIIVAVLPLIAKM